MFALTSYHEHLARLYDQRWEDLIEAIDALPVHAQSRPLVIEGEPADVLVDHAGELGLLVVGSRDMVPCAGCCSAASQMRCWSTPPAR